MSEHIWFEDYADNIGKAVVLGRLDESLIFVWGGADWNFSNCGAKPGDRVVLMEGEDIPGVISDDFETL